MHRHAVLLVMVALLPLALLVFIITDNRHDMAKNRARIEQLKKENAYRHLFTVRSTEVYYFRDNGHDCYMLTGGNVGGVHCPK